MEKYLVEDIRVKLASGIYDRHMIFIGLAGRISKEEFDSVCDFSSHTNIRPELKYQIDTISSARRIYMDYQEELRKLVQVDESMEATGKTYSDYKLRKEALDSRLNESISNLKNMHVGSLRRYLVA